jgi:hypothetical protein
MDIGPTFFKEIRFVISLKNQLGSGPVDSHTPEGEIVKLISPSQNRPNVHFAEARSAKFPAGHAARTAQTPLVAKL